MTRQLIALTGLIVGLGGARSAQARCRTYALVASASCASPVVRTLAGQLESRGLIATASPDVTFELGCAHATTHVTIGPVSVPEAFTTKTLVASTVHGVTIKLLMGDWSALDRFLANNDAEVRVEPIANTEYRVLKPDAERGTYSEAKDIRCLPSNEDVVVQAGEFTFHSRDAGAPVMRVSAARNLSYRLDYTVLPWPQPLELTLCLSLAAADCRAPAPTAGGSAPINAGPSSLIVSKRLSPAVRVTGLAGLEIPDEIATPTTGKAWVHPWRLPTGMAKRPALRLEIDGNPIPLSVTMPVPIWAGLVDLLPEGAKKAFVQNYPNSLRFGIGTILVVAGAVVVLGWLKRRDWWGLVSKARRAPEHRTGADGDHV